MRKIFVITILGFAILSHAQSNYPKNSKEKKNNVKNERKLVNYKKYTSII